MQLIDKNKLYNKLLEKEDIAMERFLSLSKVEKKNIREYIQYSTRLNEITLLKYMIADEPEVKAIPIEQIDHLVSIGIAEYNKTKKQLMKGKWKSDGYGHVICTVCNKDNVSGWKSKYCPNCGAEMEMED